MIRHVRPSRATVATLALVIVAVLGLWRQLSSQTPRPGTATLLPQGASLVLQAKDLNALLRSWNSSSAKAIWLTSANYETFSRSRLFLRLKDAYDEFATAAGVPTDMALLSDVAGDESALAMYDIGNLEFLYITRLPVARTMENALWRKRGDYEPRQAAGTAFYVRTDSESERVVAFGVKGDYLLLATREDLLAGALTLMANGSGPSVADEAWFARAVNAAPTAGDVRLVSNLETLTAEAHFRSYWVQQNITELKGYQSAVSDLFRTANDFREERLLLKAEEKPATATGAAIGAALRLVPDTAGLYRAWAAPTADAAAALVFEKVIATSRTPLTPDRAAPQVSSGNSTTGDASNLETRIDEEPRAPRAVTYDPAAWRALVGSEPLTTLLQIDTTRTGADGLFVHRDSVIVLQRASGWPIAAARDAIRAMVDPVWTKGHLSLGWIDATAGSHTVSQLEGLDSVAIATEGPLLLIANNTTLLGAVLDRVTLPAQAVQGVYAAGFRHAQERDRFLQLTRLVDHASAGQSGGEPAFFSGNVASMSEVFAGVTSEQMLVRDLGATVAQTVVYRLEP